MDADFADDEEVGVKGGGQDFSDCHGGEGKFLVANLKGLSVKGDEGASVARIGNWTGEASQSSRDGSGKESSGLCREE